MQHNCNQIAYHETLQQDIASLLLYLKSGCTEKKKKRKDRWKQKEIMKKYIHTAKNKLFQYEPYL